MKNNNHIQNWLESEWSQPDPIGGSSSTDPNTGSGYPQMNSDPNVANMDAINNPQMRLDPNAQNPTIDNKDKSSINDTSNDPDKPDMPEKKDEKNLSSFEAWRDEFFRKSTKDNVEELIDWIKRIRNKENLTPYQYKFIEDNWNVQLLRQNVNIQKASAEVRRQIREQIDKNNPATSIVKHLGTALEKTPLLNNIFIKLEGYSAIKGDLHRKYIASLIGGVQVGSGGSTEDVILNEKEYSVLISTRLNSEWGEVMLGYWSLKTDDPDKILTGPEKQRLEDGSPEEKEVLRRRIVMESIADTFKTRSFIITVVAEDGTIQNVGWDLATSLRSAYIQGKLVVRTKVSDDSQAMIDNNGNIVPLVDIVIYYEKETGEVDKDGNQVKKMIEFIEKRNGMLFMKADYKLLKHLSGSIQGLTIKEIPFTGNPTDLKSLKKCIYSSYDLLMRQC